MKSFLRGWLLILGLKKGLVECATVFIKSEVILIKGQEAHNELHELKNYINLIEAPESCGQLSLLGVTQSRRILLDPDGKGINDVPIQVST